MARYTVTGGAGFIGSSIAEELVAAGEDVVVIDDLSTGHERNIAHIRSSIEFIRGDIRNASEVRLALEGADYVLHQAALASVPRSIEDPVLVNEVNVGGTLTVLEEARRAGVRCLVFAASSSAYGESEQLPKHEDMLPMPLSPYAVSKLVGEHYCSVYSKIFGLPTMSLRYFNVFGPRQDPNSQYAAVIPIFISSLLRGEQPTIYGDGGQSRDFTFVKNVVNANLTAAKSANASGQVVNVACGERYTLNDLYRRLKHLIGSALEPRFAETRTGDVRHSHSNIALAERLLGYRVEVGFEEGLKRTVEWFRRES